MTVMIMKTLLPLSLSWPLSQKQTSSLTTYKIIHMRFVLSAFKFYNRTITTMQVIGGIQRFQAISIVNEEGKRTIRSRKCSVYGQGLPRPATLVLARQHNEFNSIQRTTSFPELAACCRRLLFSHFAVGEGPDDGTTELLVPRYNTARYREFKQECLTFLLSTQTVSIHREMSTCAYYVYIPFIVVSRVCHL